MKSDTNIFVLGLPISNQNIKKGMNDFDIHQNYADLIKTHVNVVIGESDKVVSKFIKFFKLNESAIDEADEVDEVDGKHVNRHENVEFYIVNEHSTLKDKQDIVKSIAGKNVVFFSDAGTPCISDPDYQFIDLCYKASYTVHSLPGESSVITALSICGFDCSRFYFAGFTPQKSEELSKFFARLKTFDCPKVFMERPYGFKALKQHIATHNGRVFIGFNLGANSNSLDGKLNIDELTYRGVGKDIVTKIDENIKLPFVIVFE